MSGMVNDKEKLAAAEAVIETLMGALDACMASIEHADMSDGVCCCGDSMEGHSDPMSCGHSPTDMGEYYAMRAVESARAAIATARKFMEARNG